MIGIIITAVVIAFVLLVIFLPVVAWSILAFIAFVLVVLLIIPIGVELSYLDSVFSLSAKLSFCSYKLLPRKPKQGEEAGVKKKAKKNKPKKENNPTSAAGEKAKKKLAFNFDEILSIIKKVLKGLSNFGKLKIHKFTLHYIAGGKDPYSTAMTYNYVNAALSSLAPWGPKAFVIKGDVDVWTDIDFTREKMLVDAELSITLRLIQVLHSALIAGFGVLIVLIKNKRRLSRERRAEKRQNNNLPGSNNKEENKETNIQTEERMDSNG